MNWEHSWRNSLYLLLLCLLPNVRCLQVNVTIDDQYGDPSTGQLIQYNPPAAWSIGQECEACTAKPRPIENAHRGTWMDATYFRADRGGVGGQLVTASVPFVGSAVYVQVITTGSLDFPIGRSDFTFYLDNVNVGSYEKPPDGNTSYQWNQTVFGKDGLSNSLHTLVVEVGRSDNESLFLLDSIIYTKEVDDATTSASQAGATTSASASPAPESSSSSTNIAVILGPVVGGVAAALALLAFLVFLRRRRRNRAGRALLEAQQMRSAPPGSGGTSEFLLRPNMAAGHIDPFISPVASRTPYRDSTVTTSDSSPASNVDPQLYGASSSLQPPAGHAGTKLSRYMQARNGQDPSAVPVAMPSPFTAPPAYSDVAGQT